MNRRAGLPVSWCSAAAQARSMAIPLRPGPQHPAYDDDLSPATMGPTCGAIFFASPLKRREVRHPRLFHRASRICLERLELVTVREHVCQNVFNGDGMYSYLCPVGR